MKKIGVITSTRAEYGLLSPVIKELRKFEDESFLVELIVTGTHLSEKYGLTINEINDRIDVKVPVSVDSESEIDISDNQADVLKKFTSLFYEKKYNAIILLGDRYEIMAVAIAASNTRTPIFHLCGGDTTEGALDEWVRHSITKMSYLHFVTNEVSRNRVIQMGENPERVYNYGSTSIDNILNIADLSKMEALKSIGLSGNKKYAICTFHPVTMEHNTFEEQLYSLLEAIQNFPDIDFIVTKSNADQGGEKINAILDQVDKSIDNMYLFYSLGVRRYLSLMRYAEFVIGNSSSGIIETPAFHIPTINIGDRQKGRLQSLSIINCNPEKGEIINAINTALSDSFRNECKKAKSLYGDGNAAVKIAKKSCEVVFMDMINLKKVFYDLQFLG